MEPLRDKPDIIQDIAPAEGERLLDQGAKALGISLSGFQVKQFMDYLALLRKWNRVINLTGLRSCREIVIKHFLDSLSPLPYLPEGARLLDLGSGAGFPGLPIKIVHPDQSVTLIDASGKKVSFLKEVIRHLNLGHTPVLQVFLGKGSPVMPGIGPFDTIITRAVGKVTSLLTGVDPYLAKGGKLLFMKGPEGAEEISLFQTEIRKKGFQIDRPIRLTLPFLDQERMLIFITKI